jgi:hypothetical protein
MERLSDSVLAVGRELLADLTRESPLFRALRDGVVSREAFIAWLIQTHKYMRWTYELLSGYAQGMTNHPARGARTIKVGAQRHADEERGHDVNVLLDLAALWSVTEQEARARVDATPTAPAIHFYDVVMHTTIAKFPAALAGMAATLETLGTTVSNAAHRSLREKKPFENVENAVRIFADHMDDGHHVEGGRVRIDLIEDPAERVATLMLARVTKEIYRGLIAHVEAGVSGRVVAEELATTS